MKKNENGNSGLILVFALFVMVLAIVLLQGCGVLDLGAQDRQAQRIAAQAEADRVRAEAQAQLEAERAATRQMERDAAHQRSMDTLPVLLIILTILLAMTAAVPLTVYLMHLRQAQRPQVIILQLSGGGPSPSQLGDLPDDVYRQIARAQREERRRLSAARRVTVYQEGGHHG